VLGVGIGRGVLEVGLHRVVFDVVWKRDMNNAGVGLEIRGSQKKRETIADH
jgi:hypothetical protein